MVNVNLLLMSCLGMAGWANAIWPIPVKYEHGNDTVWLSPDVEMVYNVPSVSPRKSDVFPNKC